MPEACYKHAVANLQVKNIPDELHRKLRLQAEREGRTIRDLVLDAVSRAVAREEFRERLAQRSQVDLDVSASQILQEVRAERERELGG